MKKKVILISIALAIVVISIISFTSRKSKSNREILIELKGEPFEITVVNSGELEAKNSVPIMGPDGLAAARVWSIKNRYYTSFRREYLHQQSQGDTI